MHKLFTISVILLMNVAYSGEWLPPQEMNEQVIADLEKKLKSKRATAEYLHKIYFPETIEGHLRLLGHKKYKVRKWAIKFFLSSRYGHKLKRLLISKDPEVSENCKTILRNHEIKKFQQKEAVINYLLALKCDFSGRTAFQQFYYNHRLNISPFPFLINYKLSLEQIDQSVDLYFNYYDDMEGVIPEPLVDEVSEPNARIDEKDPFTEVLKILKDRDPKKIDDLLVEIEEAEFSEEDYVKCEIIKHFEKHYPESYKLYHTKCRSRSENLGLNQLIEMIEIVKKFNIKHVKQIAESIQNRADYKERKNLYIYHFLDSRDFRVKSVALYLMKENPMMFAGELAADLGGIDEKKSGVYLKLLMEIKGLKAIFAEHAHNLICCKIDILSKLGFEILVKSPQKYGKTLSYGFWEEEKLYCAKAIQETLSTAEIEKQLISLYKINEQPFYPVLLSECLQKRGYKAGKKMTDFLYGLSEKEEDFRESLVNIFVNLKVERYKAFSLLKTIDPSDSIKLNTFSYILKNIKPSEARSYLAGCNILDNVKVLEVLVEISGALEQVFVKELRAEKGGVVGWGEFYTLMGLLKKHGRLKPLIVGLANDSSVKDLQMVRYWQIVYGESPKVTVDSIYDELVFSLIGGILRKASISELMPLFNVNLKQCFHDNFLPGVMSALGAENEGYLKTFEQALSSCKENKNKIHWCYGILNIDPKNKEALKILNEICLKDEVVNSRLAFKILLNLHQEPLLSIEKMKKLFYCDFTKYLGRSMKNLASMQEYILNKLDKNELDNRFPLHHFLTKETSSSKLITDKLIELLLSGKKIDDGIIEALLVVPDLVDTTQLDKLVKMYEDDFDADYSFIHLIIAKKQQASQHWGLVKSELHDSPKDYSVGALIAPSKEEREKYEKLLVRSLNECTLFEDDSFALINGLRDDLRSLLEYCFQKDKLLECEVKFLKKIISEKGFDIDTRETALLSLLKQGIDKKILADWVDDHTMVAPLLRVAQQYPREMSSLIPQLKESVLLFCTGMEEYANLKWKLRLSKKGKK